MMIISTAAKSYDYSLFTVSSPMVPPPRLQLLNRLREVERVSAVTAQTAAVVSSDRDRPVATNPSKRTMCRRRRPTRQTRKNHLPVAVGSAHLLEAETQSQRQRHRRHRQTAPPQRRAVLRERPDRPSTSWTSTADADDLPRPRQQARRPRKRHTLKPAKRLPRPRQKPGRTPLRNLSYEPDSPAPHLPSDLRSDRVPESTWGRNRDRLRPRRRFCLKLPTHPSRSQQEREPRKKLMRLTIALNYVLIYSILTYFINFIYLCLLIYMLSFYSVKLI